MNLSDADPSFSKTDLREVEGRASGGLSRRSFFLGDYSSSWSSRRWPSAADAKGEGKCCSPVGVLSASCATLGVSRVLPPLATRVALRPRFDAREADALLIFEEK